MHQSIENLVKNRIIDHGRGWCFTPIHFADLGNDFSIRKALSLLQKKISSEGLRKAFTITQ